MSDKKNVFYAYRAWINMKRNTVYINSHRDINKNWHKYASEKIICKSPFHAQSRRLEWCSKVNV